MNLPEGIEKHGNRLRITFSYKGQRCRETLTGLKITPANIKYADRKRNVILHEIGQNTFNYADHFPESKKAALFSGPSAKLKTVSQCLDDWLILAKANKAASTYRNYKGKAEKHVRPRWGRLLFSEITKSDIDIWLSVELADLKNKTINEVLIILRGVINLAANDNIVGAKEIPNISSLPVIFDDPDPFSKDEVKAIGELKTDWVSEQNAVVFNCWSGLRPSELIAFSWDDVDETNWIISVSRSFVEGRYKGTKTNDGKRTIELLEPAIIALKAQKVLSYAMPAVEISVIQSDNKSIKTELVRPVFICTNTNGPMVSHGHLSTRFLRPHLRKAKIRYRGHKHCRHTFASQLLTAGMPEKWVANQMGHASTDTLRKHYAKWIESDALPMAGIASQLLGFGDDIDLTVSPFPKGLKK